MKAKKPFVMRSCDTKWEEKVLENGHSIMIQRLDTDKNSGAFIERTFYKAGTVAARHRHSCGHGIYVLSGTLYTDDGTYLPGDYIWYPAGCIMEHGAGPDKDCEVLFMCDGRFDIEYL